MSLVLAPLPVGLLLAPAPLLGAHEHFADMGPAEWITAVVAALVSAWCIWKAVRYAVAPGEDEPTHIKRSILVDEPGLTDESGLLGERGVPPERALAVAAGPRPPPPVLP